MNKIFTQLLKYNLNSYKIVLIFIFCLLFESGFVKGQATVAVTIDEPPATYFILSGEQNWFSFHTTYSGTYTIQTLSKNYPTEISVYENDSSSLIARQVDESPYPSNYNYLTVSLNANTNYLVRIISTSIESDTYLFNVISEQISSLHPGIQKIGTLNTAGESDWFKLYRDATGGAIPSPGYILRTHGNTDTYLEMYGEYIVGGLGYYFRTANDNCENDKNAFIVTDELTDKWSTYYARVKGGNSETTGPYTIDFSHYMGNPEVYSSTLVTTNRTATPFSDYYWGGSTLKSVSIYHGGGTGNVLLGIYSDASGSPGSLLGVTAPTPVNTTEGWQTVPLLDPVTIPRGDQKIWLSFVFENSVEVRVEPGTNAGVTSSGSWSEGLPVTFGASSQTGYNYTVYCSLDFDEYYQPLVLNISTTEISLDSNSGASETFTVSTNSSWSFSDDAGWLDISVPAYSSNATITVTANAENVGSAPRTATITFTGTGFENQTVTVTQQGQGGPTKTTGNTDIYDIISMSANLRAMPVTFSENATIESITIYHNGGSGNLLMGIYSDLSGQVSSQLGVTATAEVSSSEGWQTEALVDPVPVDAGETVWLVWIFQNSTGIRFATGAPARAVSPATWTGALPTTFGPATYADFKYSIYCTYSSVTTTDETKPVVTDFTIPASSASFVIPVTSFTATDNTAVTGFILTETGTAPLAGDAGWSTTATTSYTFDAEGTKTLYAWAKDEAGNVSEGVSAQIEIAIPSVIGNTDVYDIISMSTNLRAMPVTFSENATIESITIYHNGGSGNLLMGVYSDLSGQVSSQLGVTATAEVSSSEGWQTEALVDPVPVNAGETVWLVWIFQNSTGVRFATGAPARAVSPASWTGTLPATFGPATYADFKYSIYCTYSTGTTTDETKPVVTDFTIPASSASLVIPVTSFTATDNIAVTGFILTETGTAPLAGDAGWSTTAPTSYTFDAEGTKTLYAWAKDEAGNVSEGVSAQIEIAIPSVIGNTDVYDIISMSTNLRAMPVTFSENATIESITIYHNGGSGNLLMGVYSDLSGQVSSQLGVTATAEVSSSEGWQTEALVDPVPVDAGETVWLVWIFQNSTGVRFATGAPARAVSPASWTGTLPPTFGPATYADFKYSIYCTYSTGTKSAVINSAHETLYDSAELKAYPNPFREKINFEFVSEKDSHALLEIYNLYGQSVTKLLDQQVEGGVFNHVEFHPTRIISGTYLYKFTLDGKTKVGKVVYNK